MSGILNTVVNLLTGPKITSNQQLPLFPTATGALVPKTMHAGTDWVGQPYLFIDSSTVTMRSKFGRGVLVDNVFGTTITGPVGIFESLENIKIGAGYWTVNPTQLHMIGSSAALPMPWLVSSTPGILSSAKTLSNSVSSLKGADSSIQSFPPPNLSLT